MAASALVLRNGVFGDTRQTSMELRTWGGKRTGAGRPRAGRKKVICEAAGAGALARGIQGWKVRVARGINRLLGRKEPVFDDRYDVQVLDSPARVRAALCYVLQNARKHGTLIGKGWADACTSARYFDGWRRTPRLPPCAPGAARPVAPATTTCGGGSSSGGVSSGTTTGSSSATCSVHSVKVEGRPIIPG